MKAKKQAVKKLVYGVGVNDADYPVCGRTAGKTWTCPFYNRWTNMLCRAYSDTHHKRYPTYRGCSVDGEWYTFSKFKLWMESQDWQGKQLDKDLLHEGNKIYSASTCVFVTRETNMFLTDSKAKRGGFPIGVYLEKDKPRSRPYRAKVSIKGKQALLGVYATPEEAHQAWRVAKYEQAVQLASEQSDPRVAAALINRYKI